MNGVALWSSKLSSFQIELFVELLNWWVGLWVVEKLEFLCDNGDGEIVMRDPGGLVGYCREYGLGDLGVLVKVGNLISFWNVGE